MCAKFRLWLLGSSLGIVSCSRPDALDRWAVAASGRTWTAHGRKSSWQHGKLTLSKLYASIFYGTGPLALGGACEAVSGPTWRALGSSRHHGNLC